MIIASNPDSHDSANWRRLLRFLVGEVSGQSRPCYAALFESETARAMEA